MSKGKVVVLGLNGHVGHAVAKAFAAAGWDVAGMARSEKQHIEGVRFVRGDAESVADMRAAIGDAEIVVNALNLPYDKWFDGRLEAQTARVIEAMGTSGKTLLFPGNVYNFAADAGVLTPGLAQHAATPRGALRTKVEQMYEAAAARGDMQVIILRAGDFYGPGSTGDWFDLVMMTGAKKGKVSLMGRPGVGHAWAYLPDLARAFEALGALRSNLGPLEHFHFAGHFVTPEQMGAAIEKASPRPVRLARFPMVLLTLMGLVDPVVREIAKMGYLWRFPLRLEDPRLEALLGPGFATPFETAVAATVAPFFGRR